MCNRIQKMLIINRTVLKFLESNINASIQYRCYVRWSYRQPRRVLTPEEYANIEKGLINSNSTKLAKETHNNEQNIIELDPELVAINPSNKIKPKKQWLPKETKSIPTIEDANSSSGGITHEDALNVFKQKKIKYKPNKFIKAPTKSVDMLETVIDKDGNFIYTKLQNNDAVVGQLLLSVKSRKEQIKGDTALIEGKRLIKEALEAKCTLKALIFSRKSDLEDFKSYLPTSGAKLYKMPYNEIQLWSDLTTSPGIMGLFKTPNVENYVSQNNLPLTLICDNIREPGNLGAVLRTAAGVGVEHVILTKGCVNLWDTKVLRSASGSHFHLKIHQKLDWKNIKELITPYASVFIADNRVVTETLQPIVNEESQTDDDGTSSSIQTLSEIMTNMPLLPYYSIEFNNVDSLVLIVGGETEGISEESYRFAADLNGCRLNIPLNNNVESLNTGTAVGIIAFEIKRQLDKFKNIKKLKLAI